MRVRGGWVPHAPSRPSVCPGRLARQDGRHALAEYLLSARPGAGGLGGTAPPTGLALQGLLAAMLAFSSPCVRRSGHFEVGATWETPAVPKTAASWGAGEPGRGAGGWAPTWAMPRGWGRAREPAWCPPIPPSDTPTLLRFGDLGFPCFSSSFGLLGCAGTASPFGFALSPPSRAPRSLPAGLLLDPPLLHLHLDPPPPPRPPLLEVVCGSWRPLRAGEGARLGVAACRGAAHRGGQPAPLQGLCPPPRSPLPTATSESPRCRETPRMLAGSFVVWGLRRWPCWVLGAGEGRWEVEG